MTSYSEFYRTFLGTSKSLEESDPVLVSEYRDMHLNKEYLYPIIFSDTKTGVICSTSVLYKDLCETHFQGDDKSIQSVFEAMKSSGDFSLRKMYRYALPDDLTAEEDPIHVDDSAVQLTEDLVRNLEFSINMTADEYIERRKPILESGQQYVVVQNRKVAATAFISDIYHTGCNIVVYTVPEFRGLGYGKAVVKACVKWCLDKKMVPIYLVEESNKASIGIAESIGLVHRHTEWVIRDLNRES